jgi:DNA-binding NarL/FixJ family response regulator
VTTVRVYVVDDHPVVLAGLVTLLSNQADLAVVGQAASGEQALAQLDDLDVDIAVIDHRLGAGIDGVALCEALTGPPHELRCLALTAGADATTVQAFVGAGASGVVPKQAGPERIVEAVRAVAAGQAYVDVSLSALFLHGFRPIDRLSERERAVLRLVGRGLSNQEIADELVVSHSSAKSYVSVVLRKLEVETRAEAAVLAVREGLLEEPAGRDEK